MEQQQLLATTASATGSGQKEGMMVYIAIAK